MVPPVQDVAVFEELEGVVLTSASNQEEERTRPFCFRATSGAQMLMALRSPKNLRLVISGGRISNFFPMSSLVECY